MDTPQDGMEQIELSKLIRCNSYWMTCSQFSSRAMKLEKQFGILPDPYSKRILIFGKSEGGDDFSFPDPDDYDYDFGESKQADETQVFTFEADNKDSVFTGVNYDSEKYTFDQNNLPIFFKGVYFVFGKNLKSIVQ